MLIPLFPLRTVLFPYARMPLQIFEPRYMDMITRCMKSGEPFGVVRICHGSEVVRAGVEESLDMEFIGTTARIVDFDALPHNRLSITIEGEQRFSIMETSVAPDQLITAEVELYEPETMVSVSHESALADVLSDLLRHPTIAELGYKTDLSNGVKVAYQLASLLPIDNEWKQEILELEHSSERLELLEELIEKLAD